MKRGFSLMELMVVIGVMALLIGVSVGAYGKMTKAAEKTKAQELVSNVATALTALYQENGCWPERLLANGRTDGLLDADRAYVLAKRGHLSLQVENKKLAGLDRFGIVTPWATAAIKRAGTKAELGMKVGVASTTVQNHILHYAIDADGDGIIKGASVGGESVDVRATAIVWCIGKDGGNKGEPWPYKQGLKRGDVYSWTYGQTQKVN